MAMSLSKRGLLLVDSLLGTLLVTLLKSSPHSLIVFTQITLIATVSILCLWSGPPARSLLRQHLVISLTGPSIDTTTAFVIIPRGNGRMLAAHSIILTTPIQARIIIASHRHHQKMKQGLFGYPLISDTPIVYPPPNHNSSSNNHNNLSPLIYAVITLYTMIKKEGDYYICEGDLPHPVPPPAAPPSQELTARGDIKERIEAIRHRLDILKHQKQTQNDKQKQLKLSEVFAEESTGTEEFGINLLLPAEILEIERRVEKLEERVQPGELQRQRVDRNPAIIDRIRRLQKKLEQMIKNKSIEILNNNVNLFAASIDEKEDNLKQLYLYEVFTRTQGLTHEINTLENYLNSVTKIQRNVAAALPVGVTVAKHNEILERREKIRLRVQGLFGRMKEEYRGLLAEIDSIEV